MTVQKSCNGISLTLDPKGGSLSSLRIGGKERLTGSQPIFRVGLRDRAGNQTTISALDAGKFELTADGVRYSDFSAAPDLAVHARLKATDDEILWYVELENKNADILTEWVDFPLASLPKPIDNDPENGGKILFPYNEGVLVSDCDRRKASSVSCYREPVYPSMGAYMVFPNMISSQMMAYLWEDVGLYIGAHDPSRAVKGIDFYDDNDGVILQFRLFSGVDFGEDFKPDYPIVWSAVGSGWQSAAEKYRAWFESALPPRAKKIIENPALPEWYKDSPLIVSYPVRGVHDMDEMTPNAFYPYTNALPMIEELNKITGSRIMVLLMHWEGTAPWAPPYVWPPYGGVENFNEFLKSLHEKGNLLGVYCSGFGYTIQSNLIKEYNKQTEYDEKHLVEGMCASYDNQVSISKICTGQRAGYDICPASPTGRKILDEAYAPLFESGLDYVQILDQNHGGGQYFCHSGDHGHPQAPGGWMTENMQKMLSNWNEKAPNMLFGCESAAAEPYIGNLQFSDNRFELNLILGRPVPLYAYIYHEYLRNFMGNQVGCSFHEDEETLPYRIAYSFAAGDAMTVVLNPSGDVLSYWGQRDFSKLPNKETVFRLIGNLTKFYKEQAAPYLFAGRMIEAPQVDCESVTYRIAKRKATFHDSFPALHATAWEANGARALILVNPNSHDVRCTVEGKEFTVPALDGLLIKM
ncbi:MAG: hypothetical protein IJW16_03435 [Clostridia bacterium]|nr:hypothetical protein [Clostridia bacterium]